MPPVRRFAARLSGAANAQAGTNAARRLYARYCTYLVLRPIRTVRSSFGFEVNRLARVFGPASDFRRRGFEIPVGRLGLLQFVIPELLRITRINPFVAGRTLYQHLQPRGQRCGRFFIGSSAISRRVFIPTICTAFAAWVSSADLGPIRSGSSCIASKGVSGSSCSVEVAGCARSVQVAPPSHQAQPARQPPAASKRAPRSRAGPAPPRASKRDRVGAGRRSEKPSRRRRLSCRAEHLPGIALQRCQAAVENNVRGTLSCRLPLKRSHR